MTVDIGIIVALIAIGYFITIQKGKRFLLTLILSLYVTIPVVKYLFIDTQYIAPSTMLIAFLVVLILAYVGIKKYIKNYQADGTGGRINALIISVSATILILTAYFYYLPETLWVFSADIRDLFFYSPSTLGILYAIPLAAFFVSSKDD